MASNKYGFHILYYRVIPCLVIQILEIFLSSFLWILMQYSIGAALVPNGQVKNMWSMCAIISKLQAIYFYIGFIEKATEYSLGYFKSHVLVYYLSLSNSTEKSCTYLCKDLENSAVFYLIRTVFFAIWVLNINKIYDCYVEALVRPRLPAWIYYLLVSVKRTRKILRISYKSIVLGKKAC